MTHVTNTPPILARLRALVADLRRTPLPISTIVPTMQQAADELERLAALVQPSQGPIDAEALILACVPGGSTCDPQQVADEIRRYLDAWPQRAETSVALAQSTQVPAQPGGVRRGCDDAQSPLQSPPTEL